MKLHPIIECFVNTEERMLSILERHHTKGQFLESVFIRIYKLDEQQLINEELKIDQNLLIDFDKAIIKGHPDTNVYLLFLVTAMRYMMNYDQFDKANSLHSIALSLKIERSHPFIRALHLQAIAYIKRHEGKGQVSNQLMEESMSIVISNCPRKRTLIFNYLSILAMKGELNDSKEFDLNLVNSPTVNRPNSAMIKMKIANCCMIGDYKKGYDIVNVLKSELKEKNDLFIEEVLVILNIISGDLNENNYQHESIKPLIKAMNALVAIKLEEAAISFNLFLKSTYGGINLAIHSDFRDTFHFNLELCKGNKGVVRLLLKENERKRCSQYMDDLFYGRLYLLDKNYDAADECFSRLIENVKRFGAMNRLIFELQFAKEMKLSDIFKLTQGWQIDKKPAPSKIKEEQKIDTKMIKKGIKLLIGNSSAINQIKEIVIKFATLKAPILVTGETGTGKELVSRAIHDEGPYSKEPFLAINCGALTDSLLQSELFGYVAGAFTGAQKERLGIFEAAGKGTVFLDEFGDISPKMQVSLLRVLETNEIRMIGGTKNRKIECRIVIATNIDLQQIVKEKKFREDLYYRLTKFEIRLPALRERKEDLPELIEYFFETNRGYQEKQKVISKELLAKLSSYSWPGNIRELKNEIDRLYVLCSDKEILNIEDFDFTHLQSEISKPISYKENTKKKEMPDLETKHFETDKMDDQLLNLIHQSGPQIDRRHILLNKVFQKHKKLTRSQVMAITKSSPATATKDLKILCASGFIVRRSPTNSSRTDYFELVEK